MPSEGLVPRLPAAAEQDVGGQIKLPPFIVAERDVAVNDEPAVPSIVIVTAGTSGRALDRREPRADERDRGYTVPDGTNQRSGVAATALPASSEPEVL